jgi:SAM-dependent methyltransferase
MVAVAAAVSEEALEVETPVCDLCGNAEQWPLFKARDRRYGFAGEFSLVECTHCNLQYVSPRPVASVISRWYPTQYGAYRKKQSWWQKAADWVEDKIWNAYLRVFLTRSYPIFYFPKHEKELGMPGRAPRVLDVGCGSGDKLRYIRAHSGFETFGVDFSPQAVENANARGAGDVRLTRGDRLPFDDNHFDAVMSWHSLEHHYSPKATMAEVFRVLRPGGYGIFAVPAAESVGLRLFKSYWGPLEIPRHLYYFTHEAMKRLVEGAGFRVEKVYDDISFYGLFLAQEIFDSCQFALEDKLGKGPSLPLRLPFKLLNAGGLISSAATLPLIALNPVLGRLWRGSNMIVHFRKP